MSDETKRESVAYLTAVKGRVLGEWASSPSPVGSIGVEFSISADGCVPWLRFTKRTVSGDRRGVLGAFRRVLPFRSPPPPIADTILEATFSTELRS